jgi:tetratricopeptide (TPR) repeat protein
MRLLFIVMLMFLKTLHAGMIDEYYLFRALHVKNHTQALLYYRKISTPTDAVRYNIATLLYREKKFEAALEEFGTITSQRLHAAVLYDMANCYVRLGALQKAAKTYQEVLLLHNDMDAAYNLHQVLEAIQRIKRHKRQFHFTSKMRQGAHKIDKTKKHPHTPPQDNTTPLKTKQKKTKKMQLSFVQRQFKDKLAKAEHKKGMGENTLFSVFEQKRWDEKLGSKALRTLLIPLNTQGDFDETRHDAW